MTVRVPDAFVQQVLFEHDVLRALLSRFDDAAERCAQGKLAAQDLRDPARTLDAALEAHARHEEEILAPILEAQGQTTAFSQLRDSHRRVIELLRKLRSSDLKRSASGSARLARHILAALDAEDRELRGANTGSGRAVH